MYATNIPLKSQPGNLTGVDLVGILPAFRLQEEVEGDLIYSTVFLAILLIILKEIHVIR